MASVTSPNHRHQPTWLIVVEEFILAVCVFAIVVMLIIPLGRTAAVSDWLAKFAGSSSGRVAIPGEPLSFFAATRPMMHAIESATKLESEGEFGEATRAAWAKAAAECRRFAVQPIIVSGREPIQIWLLEAEHERAAALEAELENPEETSSQSGMLVRRRDEALANVDLIQRYRELSNFDFWLSYCDAGSTDSGLKAREAGWQAEHAYGGDDLPEAKVAYERSFVAWREVLDASTVLRNDELLADDLADMVSHYRIVLDRLGVSFPQPFILQDVLERSQPF